VSGVKPRAISNPPNPWLTSDVEWLEPQPARLEILADATREILSRNDSPDIGFTWSVNPYRGCLHACAYCYARAFHEYLGHGAGTDFETKLVVKLRAPELLRAAFERPGWKGETVAFSGGTDAWQPLEASYRLTRRCLEVCAEYRNPVCIVTKGALLERDLDVLLRLRDEARVSVAVSVPYLDDALARRIEPLASSPSRRLRLIRRLAEAGLSPTVLVAPVIPGLDDELPRVLAAARDAGAVHAGWQLLRLPGPVAPVFEARIREALPERAERILHLIRETRGGELSDERAGRRMRGGGPYAATIAALFRVSCERLGFAEARFEEVDTARTTFRRPGRGAQLALQI
jgi:DNA repair photolyase